MSTAINYDAQPSLLEKMKKAGFNTNPEGVCAGATMVAIEAAVNGSLSQFDKTIEFINSESFKLQRLKPGRKLFLTKEDQQLLDAHATLDQIQLYHKPENYHDLFTQTVSQYEAGHIAKIAQSNKSIEEKGFITRENWSWSGIYKNENLVGLLEIIKKSATIDQTLAFNVGSTSHKIALIYKQGNWTLTNINQMPSKVYSDTKKLAKKIIKVLGDESKKIATLGISAYSTGKNATETQEFFYRLRANRKFRKIHNITKKKIKNEQGNTMSLAQLAICNHQIDMLRDLIKNGLDINTLTPSGHHLIFLAAQYGFTDIVKLLKEAGADINAKSGVQGLTPLITATEYQHSETISYLLGHGADVEQETDQHVTPILMAIHQGNLEAVKILTNNGAKLNKATFFGTPLEYAENTRNNEVIDFIKKELDADQSSSKLS